MVDTVNPRKQELFERKLKAYEMYVDLYTYREIGKVLGVSYEMVRKYINEISQLIIKSNPAIDSERTTTTRRLNKALKKAYKDYYDGDSKVLGDIVRIEDRRAKLLGLDAAQKQENGGIVTVYLKESQNEEL